jgi:hypothetical protein
MKTADEHRPPLRDSARAEGISIRALATAIGLSP